MKSKENKKIKNATFCESNGIKFKSQLEKVCYNTLFQLGFNPLYEPRRITIYNFRESLTPFYDKETDSQHKKRIELLGKRDSKILRLASKKMINITYTPDIYISYKNLDVWLEIKGFENDVFKYKKKLFREYLDTLERTLGKKSIYFEIYTKRQLLQAIEIFKQYAEEIK